MRKHHSSDNADNYVINYVIRCAISREKKSEFQRVELAGWPVIAVKESFYLIAVSF